MTTVAVRHRVTDYGKWRAIFDEHGAARAAHGEKSTTVLRDAADPNEILVIISWPAMANAQAFLDDPSLKEAMSQAGLAGPPRVEVYEEAGA
ncbi:MAG TPA: DUF1330 domain-containing protein [Streptosporangiaceae bacterium]|nr:DUF1330 domain-containing protein [Streptosporangiaceae bacterium]